MKYYITPKGKELLEELIVDEKFGKTKSAIAGALLGLGIGAAAPEHEGPPRTVSYQHAATPPANTGIRGAKPSGKALRRRIQAKADKADPPSVERRLGARGK